MRYSQRLLSVVFLNGLVVMAVEMIAGRLVTPFFGSTVYTWGTVIGVYMAALSLGYYAGGEFSDYSTPSRTIGWALGGVAVSLLFLRFAYDPILRIAQLYLGTSRFDVLWPAVAIFGPAATFGGFISPAAIADFKGRSRGQAAGRVYSLGTIGSLAGVFGAIYVLIPFLHVNTALTALIGLSLFNFCFLFPDYRLILPALLIFAVSFLSPPAFASDELVMRKITPYQSLSIYEQDGRRYLYLGGTHRGISSQVDLSDPDRLVPRYAELFALPFYAEPIDRALLIGGGGFKLSDHLLSEHPNLRMDVAEIDPAVVEAAYQYMGSKKRKRRTVHVEDGRQVLQQNGPYDAIGLDAFQHGANIPFHLATKEFVEKVHSNLSSGGFFVVNYVSIGPGDERLFRFFANTVASVFPQGVRLEADGGNSVLLFRKGEPLTKQDIRGMLKRFPFKAPETLRVVTKQGEQILTDGWAPISSF